ncbi:MAG: hypothetical protein J6Y19_12310, partial [Kiritimatiellae bacterium]|nr:hypothetical protein [Kiritimatiellia bacterium]
MDFFSVDFHSHHLLALVLGTFDCSRQLDGACIDFADGFMLCKIALGPVAEFALQFPDKIHRMLVDVSAGFFFDFLVGIPSGNSRTDGDSPLDEQINHGTTSKGISSFSVTTALRPTLRLAVAVAS